MVKRQLLRYLYCFRIQTGWWCHQNRIVLFIAWIRFPSVACCCTISYRRPITGRMSFLSVLGGEKSCSNCTTHLIGIFTWDHRKFLWSHIKWQIVNKILIHSHWMNEWANSIIKKSKILKWNDQNAADIRCFGLKVICVFFSWWCLLLGNQTKFETINILTSLANIALHSKKKKKKKRIFANYIRK